MKKNGGRSLQREGREERQSNQKYRKKFRVLLCTQCFVERARWQARINISGHRFGFLVPGLERDTRSTHGIETVGVVFRYLCYEYYQ